MCAKMAISAHILKIVEKGPFLRLQMRAKETFSTNETKQITYQSKGSDKSYPTM